MNFSFRRLNRRSVLQALGVSLALPWLESLRDSRVAARPGGVSADHQTPQRFVGINIPLGFHPESFFPAQAGRDYELSPYLQAAAEHRERFTVVSGTSHPEVDGGHSAEKSFLTAAPHPGARSFKNTISLDQYIAGKIGDQTRFASLTLGDHTLSWSANGVPVPTMNRPQDVFARLFLKGTDRDLTLQQQRLDDGQSILDVVLADAQQVQRRVSRADQQKLEQYFDAVRETERRLTKEGRWLETPKPVVSAEPPQVMNWMDFTRRLSQHLDVIFLALQTDSTRVATLGGTGGSEVPPLAGVDTGYHALSHHGMNPQLLQQLAIVEAETIRVWAKFLTQLHEAREGDRSLLDQTRVLLGSNLGSGSGHLTTNLPILLAGGRFRHGQHLAFDQKQNYPLANLFVSCLQDLGIETDRFASGHATMTGLT